MQKLQWFTFEELGNLEPNALVKCFGSVKSVDKSAGYYSFVGNQCVMEVSDENSQAEATIYDDEKVYSVYDLPKKNDYVTVMGNTYKKQLSNKNAVVKIRIRSYNIIPQLSILSLKKKVEEAKKKRQNGLEPNSLFSKTKRSLLKQMKLVIQPIEIRSLILSCVYLTLENNPDLNNYIFNIHTIQMHRLTRSFLESKKLKEQSIEYLPEFIHPELRYLLQNHIIEQKNQDRPTEDGKSQKIYKIYRNLFIDVEQKIIGIIYENKKKGTMLNQIVIILNRDLLKFALQKNYVINENLVQKVLRKLIQESKIYKTSQKVLYPNS